MEYQKIDCKSYNIHTIKVNRFKTTKIEAFFRLPITEDQLGIYAFLADMLKESTKKYPSRRLLTIKGEELYQCNHHVYANKVGNCLNFVFAVDFISPEYIEEDHYIEEVIKFLCEIITNPNVSCKEFMHQDYEIVKNNLLLDIDSIEEDAEKKAINSALKAMDAKSISAFNILGTKEDIKKITREELYDCYLYLMNNAMIDFFVVGNTDTSKIAQLIKKHFLNHRLRNHKITYYIDNKTKRHFDIVKECSSFTQSQLVMIYNLEQLTKDEKEVTFHLLNYILGSGGLTSKLYRYIREENNYCYCISSMYFKYDNLLCIASSLSLENIDKAIKLVKKAIKEMQKGIFSDNELQEAKRSLSLSLNVNKNNPNAILANYEFEYFLGNYTIPKKIALLENISREAIVRLAKKIKANTIYVLSEASNERN